MELITVLIKMQESWKLYNLTSLAGFWSVDNIVRRRRKVLKFVISSCPNVVEDDVYGLKKGNLEAVVKVTESKVATVRASIPYMINDF